MTQRRQVESGGKLPLTVHQRRQLLRALRHTQDAKLYRRLLAVVKLDQGHKATQIAELLEVDRTSIYIWLRRYLQHRDPFAVADRAGRGRKSLFDKTLQDLLDQTLALPPRAWGYQANCWTVPLLCDHLQRLSDRPLSISTLGRHLRAHRYAFKRPRYRLVPDPEYRKKSVL